MFLRVISRTGRGRWQNRSSPGKDRLWHWEPGAAGGCRSRLRTCVFELSSAFLYHANCDISTSHLQKKETILCLKTVGFLPSHLLKCSGFSCCFLFSEGFAFTVPETNCVTSSYFISGRWGLQDIEKVFACGFVFKYNFFDVSNSFSYFA